ncbi:unnamed protein product [Caenorhabditis bovis]|uniref:Uncharacterized protein n=1 Tax=Caenorhabditis bovis TaxID=2654633 RepID=A0A8S1FDH0_9PELO|nr:unnamed protein product [Caenorhabditis bovis]
MANIKVSGQQQQRQMERDSRDADGSIAATSSTQGEAEMKPDGDETSMPSKSPDDKKSEPKSPDVVVDDESRGPSSNLSDDERNQSEEAHETPTLSRLSGYRDEDLIAGLASWEWVTIDGLQLPAVSRNRERYVAVHMVQLKLLSKFPSDIPPEILQKYTMHSHKMTTIEAWTFNAMNATIRKFDLGCQLFTDDDELVKLNDVQMFYWNVKLINLHRISKQYENTIAMAEGNTNLLATVMILKAQVENDIEAVKSELEKKQTIHHPSGETSPISIKPLLISTK